MSIKYYQLAKGEEMPDEFCVVRDVNGEPSEYMFYVPEAENAKLRELVLEMRAYINGLTKGLPIHGYEIFDKPMHELGVICE